MSCGHTLTTRNEINSLSHTHSLCINVYNHFHRNPDYKNEICDTITKRYKLVGDLIQKMDVKYQMYDYPCCTCIMMDGKVVVIG